MTTIHGRTSQLFCLMFMLVLLGRIGGAHAGEIVVIGNANLTKVDRKAIAKIYTGKMQAVDGIAIVAVNAGQAHLRERFLQTFLNQDNEKYVAYWTVRRYTGQGAPPRELGSAEEMIAFVRSTPGAIGYVDEADLQPGVNVLARKKDETAGLFFRFFPLRLNAG